jgi:DNA-binding XRE family transcriptional regulator
MESAVTIRVELKQARKRAGFTLKTLALECECHPSTICHIERGREQPSIELFARLAQKLELTPTKLLAMLNVWPPRGNGSVVSLQRQRERRQRRH